MHLQVLFLLPNFEIGRRKSTKSATHQHTLKSKVVGFAAMARHYPGGTSLVCAWMAHF